MSLATKIMQAAIGAEAHVFVTYMPHTHGLYVYAHEANTDYHDTSADRPRLMDEIVYLDRADTAERLADVLAQIEEL